MLGQHVDVVRRKAQRSQITSQAGGLAATCGSQHTQARRRDGGVRAVAKAGGVRHYRMHRQTQLGGKGAAGKQQGAATFGLKEAAATTVIRTRDEAIIDALGGHLGGLGGGVHVAEALKGFHLHVINTTGDDKVRLAQRDLVHSLLNTHRGSGTRADRVDHGAVAANQRLHGVRGHHVRQRFLQDVALTFLTNEAGDEHLVQRLHTADTGALGGCHKRWVHRLHQLTRGKACGDERIHGGNQVPGGHAVHAVSHLRRDAPLRRVKIIRDLARNGAR